MGFVLPFSGVIAVMGPVFGESSPEQQLLEEQRGRIALSLMADAGYDPWQAPEAWRLMQPKRLPGDVSALPYPDRRLSVERAQPTVCAGEWGER